MRVLLVGGGGREHALAWRLSQSPSLTGLWFTHDNPGFAGLGEVRVADTIDAQVELAEALSADLVVVGPEAPLAAGLADRYAERGIPCFGPTREAARLETSKAFTKEVCEAAGVPTARALVVERGDPAGWAAARARCEQGAVVLKADGLAAGKGVIVCPTAEEALAALDDLERFGAAADRVLLEDLLSGPEVSVFALCDGSRTVALPSSQDHKTLLDGGRGPNTGGMGAYAPCHLLGPEATEALVADVHQRVIEELARRGTPYRGALYGGFMLTAEGPMLLEFNARFGDPECQPLMTLWDEDVLPWLHGAATGELPAGRPTFARDAACCVVLASAGYPRSSQKGVVIPEPAPSDQVVTFQAGTARNEAGQLVTAGGRVLGVTARGHDVADARDRAYRAVPGWQFDGAQWRADIGHAGR